MSTTSRPATVAAGCVGLALTGTAFAGNLRWMDGEFRVGDPYTRADQLAKSTILGIQGLALIGCCLLALAIWRWRRDSAPGAAPRHGSAARRRRRRRVPGGARRRHHQRPRQSRRRAGRPGGDRRDRPRDSRRDHRRRPRRLGRALGRLPRGPHGRRGRGDGPGPAAAAARSLMSCQDDARACTRRVLLPARGSRACRPACSLMSAGPRAQTSGVTHARRCVAQRGPLIHVGTEGARRKPRRSPHWVQRGSPAARLSRPPRGARRVKGSERDAE